MFWNYRRRLPNIANALKSTKLFTLKRQIPPAGSQSRPGVRRGPQFPQP